MTGTGLGNALSFAAGLLLLYVGAEGLVRGASRLAGAFGVSALVIGLTVVAFGTSAPELVVSTLSAWQGRSDVALGNVVGSNIANVGLILGLSAALYPIRVEVRLIRREILVVIAASIGLLLLVADGTLGRLDAGLLLLGFAGFTLLVLRGARSAASELSREPPPETAAEPPNEPTGEPTAAAGRGPPAARWRATILLTAGGLLGLVLGAHVLVESSVWFAQRLGVSELVIGLTVVAGGTSLPELATSVVAAVRRKPDIAIGNVVGSNIINILAILGVAGLVRPLEAAPSLLRFDGLVMVGAAVLLLPLAWSRFRLERWEGALLVSGYAGYLVAVFVAATRG